MHIALQPVTVAPRLRAFLPRRRLALYVRKPRARETTADSSELLHRLQVAPVFDVTRSSLWNTDDAKNLSGAECRFVDVPDGTVMLRAGQHRHVQRRVPYPLTLGNWALTSSDRGCIAHSVVHLAAVSEQTSTSSYPQIA